MYTRRVRQLTLLILDISSFYLALWAALSIRGNSWISFPTYELHLPLFSMVFVGSIFVYYIFGLYDESGFRQPTKGITQVTSAGILNFLLATLFFYLLQDPGISPKTILALTIVFGATLAYLIRYTLGNVLHAHQALTVGLIATTDDEVTELQRLATHSSDIEIVWTNDMPAIEEIKQVQALCITDTALTKEENKELLFRNAVGKKRILSFATLYERITGKVPASSCNDEWFITNIRTHATPYMHTRTIIDYLCGGVLSLITLFLFPLISLSIKLTSRGPIIFTQTRVGKNGNTFTLYKFRTMYALAPDGSAEVYGAIFSKKGDTRITPVGKFLRKTRLDELPQCINLLKRDTSIIGPRPERPEIIASLSEDAPYFSARTLVKPGITGWAAVQQHYTDTKASTIEKLQYDLYYIKHQSLILDFKILLLTIRTVLHMKGQ